MSTYNPYVRFTGLKKATFLLSILIVFFIVGQLIVKMGIIAILGLVALPFVIAILYLIFANPRNGIIVSFIVAFLVNSIGRYVTGPFGLMLDGILYITFIATVFNITSEQWKVIRNPIVLLVFIWFFFTIVEIFNPEATSFEAWFYAVRGIAFYMVFLVMLGFLIYNKEKDFDLMIWFWFIGAIISALYGMKQLYIGLNAAEKAWLASGAGKTHVLFGRLRVFSFYSDAGQFGAFMGFTSVVSTILALHDYGFKKRIFYLITAAITFYGMAISGTRGALFVPLTGFLVYLFLSKNFKTLSAGAAVLGILFYILKFTFIGQGNYQVQRMRSALDPNDASFQARIENQKKFNDYLSTRPFGGGIGTAGFWGQRFSPGTFLAETPTDSHYVRIWAETGIVGLVVHILVLISILGISFFRIYKMTDVAVKQKLMAIFAGCAGIIVASYGNQVMGQMPTNVYFYISLALIYLGPHWEKNSVLDKHL